MPELVVNGVSLYYEEHGVGEPIVCIHGTSGSAVFWEDAAAVLARRGRTIVYDRRGSFRSERPEPYVTNAHEHADDAAALIDALGAAPAIVIGRSYGGDVAVDLTLRYPERVRALALLEGGGFTLSGSMMAWIAELNERVFAAAETDMRSVGETFLRDVLGDAGWEGLPGPAKQIFTANGPAIVAEERGGPLEVSAHELATIVQPVLLVGAKVSPPPFQEMTDLMASAMPAARVELVEGGHLIDPAHPAVLAFVDAVLTASERAGIRV